MIPIILLENQRKFFIILIFLICLFRASIFINSSMVLSLGFLISIRIFQLLNHYSYIQGSFGYGLLYPISRDQFILAKLAPIVLFFVFAPIVTNLGASISEYYHINVYDEGLDFSFMPIFVWMVCNVALFANIILLRASLLKDMAIEKKNRRMIVIPLIILLILSYRFLLVDNSFSESGTPYILVEYIVIGYLITLSLLVLSTYKILVEFRNQDIAYV